MGLRINTNIAALNSYRNLTVSDGSMAKSLEKLSSGFRINRAGDDAAGLVISEKLRAQVNGLRVAQRNAQDGVSVVQTAEGALNETQAILQRVRELAVQAANAGSNDSASIGAIQAEVNQLVSEVDRIASTTTFNGATLLGGGYSGTFQVGANAGETITVTVGTSNSSYLGSIGGGAFLASLASTGNVINGASALAVVDQAIKDVSSTRGALGAVQNRLEHTIANLSVAEENLTASYSRIRDTDMAKEMTDFTRHQILMQAGTAMLAQANSAPQSIMQLLRG